jgi:hypothetical protein
VRIFANALNLVFLGKKHYAAAFLIWKRNSSQTPTRLNTFATAFEKKPPIGGGFRG